MKNFNDILQQMQRHQMPVPRGRTIIKIPNAHQVLKNAMQYFLSLEGRKMQWLKAYDEVADWLSGNKGRGLFLYGSVGQGKSILSRYVIPAIFLKYTNRVVSVYDIDEMNAKLDEVKRKKFISLDDIGTEATINNFGNKREAFAEIIDNVEKQNNLVVISTNLSKEAIVERYGDRVFDRIVATTRRILFTGESLRK